MRFAYLFRNVCEVHFPDKIVSHQRRSACGEERLRDQIVHALELAPQGKRIGAAHALGDELRSRERCFFTSWTHSSIYSAFSRAFDLSSADLLIIGLHDRKHSLIGKPPFKEGRWIDQIDNVRALLKVGRCFFDLMPERCPAQRTGSRRYPAMPMTAIRSMKTIPTRRSLQNDQNERKEHDEQRRSSKKESLAPYEGARRKARTTKLVHSITYPSERRV